MILGSDGGILVTMTLKLAAVENNGYLELDSVYLNMRLSLAFLTRVFGFRSLELLFVTLNIKKTHPKKGFELCWLV